MKELSITPAQLTGWSDQETPKPIFKIKLQGYVTEIRVTVSTTAEVGTIGALLGLTEAVYDGSPYLMAFGFGIADPNAAQQAAPQPATPPPAANPAEAPPPF